MDENNIINFKPGQVWEIKRKPHNCNHYHVSLLEETRTVECEDCKRQIDAFDFLWDWAVRRFQFHRTEDILKQQCKQLGEKLDNLKREERNIKSRLKRLKAYSDDSRRIDWIDRNMDCDLSGPGLHISSVEIGDEETLRQAIDRVAAEVNREPL